MSLDSIVVDAPPSSVFGVLSDPRRYENFVVGNARIRRFDPRWPEEGSTFAHSLGMGPLVVKDTTTSIATDDASYLVLETRMGPLGTSVTVFRIGSTESGTRVEIQEDPISGPMAWVWNPLLDRALGWRNRWLLRRLGKLAERRFGNERSVPPAANDPGTERHAG
ncbi:MAG TPA: SRPBCC family protein [Acidimicrobiia bacterium]|nr:SRPBCC family protein [Acidimicrobiia bacterium]